MVRGSPCMCIRHTPASEAATASSAPGARSALMSFTIEAPSAIAWRITSGLTVSTETGTGRSRRPLSTGSSRRNSSSGGTATSAPGRLDSAPTSTISAPSSTRRRARSTAAPASRKRPPSEKESGVTLTTPATSGRSSARRNLPQRRLRAVTAADMKRPEAGFGPRSWNELSDGCRLGRTRRPRLGRLLRRLRGLGRARRPAVHDVLDLLGVDGFQLEQGLGHGLDLVAVVEDELLREAVLLVDDLADLGVDLLHRHFGHVLVRGDRASEEHLPLVLAVHHGAHRVRHAPLSHHAAREGGGALEIVRSTGRHLAHENFLGDAPAEEHRNRREQAIPVHAVPVLLGQLHGHAQRPPAR